jgi:hypothetical protein
MSLDNLVYPMRISEIVDSSDIVPLFEYQVPIVEDAREESVLLYINLEYTLQVHELYVIDEDQARMHYNDRFFAHEHRASIEVDNVQYNLYEEIIDRDEECWEEYMIAKIRRKNPSIFIKNPRK